MTTNQSAKLRAELQVTPVAAKAKIVEALEASHGIAIRACVLLGISRRSMVRVLDDYPELKTLAKTLRSRATAARASQTTNTKEGGEVAT